MKIIQGYTNVLVQTMAVLQSVVSYINCSYI